MPGAGGVQQSLGVYNGETTRAPARLTQRPAPRRTLTLGCAAVCLQSCPRVTAITIVSFGGGGAGGDDGGRLRQTPQLDSHFSANVSILHLTSLSKKVPTFVWQYSGLLGSFASSQTSHLTQELLQELRVFLHLILHCFFSDLFLTLHAPLHLTRVASQLLSHSYLAGQPCRHGDIVGDGGGLGDGGGGGDGDGGEGDGGGGEGDGGEGGGGEGEGGGGLGEGGGGDGDGGGGEGEGGSWLGEGGGGDGDGGGGEGEGGSELGEGDGDGAGGVGGGIGDSEGGGGLGDGGGGDGDGGGLGRGAEAATRRCINGMPESCGMAKGGRDGEAPWTVRILARTSSCEGRYGLHSCGSHAAKTLQGSTGPIHTLVFV